MGEFESYFSDDNIIKLLCKYRIKLALDRHKLHLLADISSSSKVIKDFKEKAQIPAELNDLLPKRRKWYRPNVSERKRFSDPQKLNEFALIKSIQIQRKKTLKGSEPKPGWLNRLEYFIQSVKERSKNPSSVGLHKPKIVPVRKEKSKLCLECRPISVYEAISDRVILSLTAKYFTNKFDHVFQDCSYAFRAVKIEGGQKVVRTHHDTIKRIVQYLNERKAQKIYVAECDLQKFFDCINHEIILQCLNELSSASNILLEESAITIFKQYLNSYSFSQSVFPHNKTTFFEDFKMPGAKFPWVEKDLINKFYDGEDISNGLVNKEIGVPQGGAISTFISNLVLHFVDKEVSNEADSNLLYLRFCDDMVLFHVDKEKCQLALDRYLQAIKKRKLLIHEPKDVGNYSKEFWTKNSKSKKPYLWGPVNAGRSNIPYVAFVGYQVRYDGLVRIRKRSIEKELKKQREECNTIIDSLKSKAKKMDEISKKSRGQQVYAILNRLISMSVGRIRLFDKSGIQSLCWANGFKALAINDFPIPQLKILDRSRRANLKRIEKKLNEITKPSTDTDDKSEFKIKYFGAPFSYFGIQHRKSDRSN
jgi:hypothetical protein